jgi:hypothetical protein
MKNVPSMPDAQQARNLLSELCLNVIELPAASRLRQAKLFPLAALFTLKLSYGKAQEAAFRFLERNMDAGSASSPYLETLVERLFNIAENEKLAEGPRVVALSCLTRVIGEDFRTHDVALPRLERLSSANPDNELGNYAKYLHEQLTAARNPRIDFETYRPRPHTPLYDNLSWGRARNGGTTHNSRLAR